MQEENKIKWKKLLKEGKAYCYIKTNNNIHKSGYKCFEVGYLVTNESTKKAEEKLILSEHSDSFLNKVDFLNKIQPVDFSMDVLLDGHIRIFNRREVVLTWQNRYDRVESLFIIEEMKE